MKLVGISLRRPNFAEVTAATVMAVGLWMAAVGALLAGKVHFERADAGALLVVLTWACLSTRMGIHVGQSRQHLLLNLGGCSLLLGVYFGLLHLAG